MIVIKTEIDYKCNRNRNWL